MTLAVALFGIFFAVLGVTGILSPPRLFAFIARWQSQEGIYYTAGLRLLLGIALILAAPTSRAPVYLQVFGVVAALAGLATPFFGLRRFEALLGWWRERPPALLRVWCIVIVAIGVSCIWAVFPALHT